MSDALEVGQQFTNKKGAIAEVEAILPKSRVKIIFKSTGYTNIVSRGNLVKNRFGDPLHKSILGVAYFGVGEFVSKHNSKYTREYSVWYKMIDRCYNILTQEKHPTYKTCKVCDEWLNFQNFAQWYTNQPGHTIYELDKDLLVSGNKVYSPMNCVLIPKELNIALQEKRNNSGDYPPGVYYKKKNKNFVAQLALGNGVQKHLGSLSTPEQARLAYVQAKKEHLKNLAELFCDRITEQVYNALCKWEPVK